MDDKKTSPFLTYEEQIEKLKNKKLKIDEEESAIEILKNTSYYSLINGYKVIFKDNSNDFYKQDVSFDNFYQLYLFDVELRRLVMNYILILERKIKSIYSYSFCKKFGDGQDEYFKGTNYNYSQFQNKINELLTRLQSALNSNKPYINHYKAQYKNVPLWVLVNNLTLGNISVAFECAEQSLQAEISKEFRYGVFPNQLTSMLSVLTKFRNVCAHNERLFMYTSNKSITDMPIHRHLAKGKGKKDIFAVCIIFKYLLDKREFSNFLNEFIKLIKQYLSDMPRDIYDTILTKMGLVAGWDNLLASEIKVTISV